MRRSWICLVCWGCGVLIVLMVTRTWSPMTMNASSRYSLDTVPRDSVCESEHQHLYFLKTHKSGSTTVQNIFLRYSLHHHLKMLTIFNGRFNSHPLKTFDRFLPPTPAGLINGKYDMYCEHSVYDEKYLLSKLHADTVNIAILREPMAQLRSSFNFFHLTERMKLSNVADPVAVFLEKPEHYVSTDQLSRRITTNWMAMEFGFEEQKHDLKEYLSYIESKFLVLIMERLSESLIVMKRKLCWSMKYILCGHTRHASYGKPAATNRTLVGLHKAWSPRDYAFYSHFSSVMARTIAAQDDDFQQEVDVFDEYLTQTSDFCDTVCNSMGKLVGGDADRESIRSLLHNTTYFPATKWEPAGFLLNGLDCLLMRFDPAVFRNIQKVRLFPEFCFHNNVTLERLDIKPRYCADHFEKGIPWSIIKRPMFVSTCYKGK